MTQASLSDAERLLAQDMGRFYDDPLAFVQYAYPWGQGELGGFLGPDVWQAQFLRDIGTQVKERGFDGVTAVNPILEATASGHGIGKSALVAWIINWIMSTRPMAKGVVTANTAPQLETKTWSELAKWTRRLVNKHWFEVRSGRGSMKMYHRSYPDTWRVDGLTCREENSESFAGLHAANSTPFFIFDEASAVPNIIWEVAEGGLTDGEPMWFVFGNPTRNTGRFRECFGRLAHRWHTRQIDSRTVAITNKDLLGRWVDDYGEDSDFVRVRVKGQFPRASDMQFIPTDVVTEAMAREESFMPDDPLILGVDVARGGGDRNVLFWRRGHCAKPTGPARGAGHGGVPDFIVIPGEETRDSMRLVSVIVQHIIDTKPDAVFIDATGIGGPIGDRCRQLGFPVFDVQFGAKAMSDPKCANMRAFMWMRMRTWLMEGGQIPDISELEQDLTAPEYTHNARDQLLLESKEKMKDRGLASPDIGDALGLTFAMPVSPLGQNMNVPQTAKRDHDPLA